MSILEHKAALEANSADWELRYNLVAALVAEGQHESAVTVVNEGEDLPREAAPWLAAAKCYAAVGALEQARGLVESSLHIDPDYEPAKEYQAEVEASIAAAAPVEVDEEDAEAAAEETEEEADKEEEAVAVAVAVVEEDEETEEGVPAPAIAEIVRDADHDDPIALPAVSFESHEMDAIRAAEEESKRIVEAGIRRDKMNSVIITVLLHVVIIVGLMLVATKVPPNVPPQIVASAANQQQEDTIDNTKMEKPTVQPTATNTAVADIVSVQATSNFSVSNMDIQVADVAVESGLMFSPSMSMGMPSSNESKMMFGQPMEGNVLGVILDVSGSMAEYLPAVVREVDKNFKDAPVVYVRNMLVRAGRESDNEEIRLIIPEEVKPYYELEIGGRTRSPFWFLWHDLPRKAPQRYVDRLIETYKTRPNQFISVGSDWGHRGRVVEAVSFLLEQKVDSLYIFSDFEDFVDEEVAADLGSRLGRQKIRTYLQPAEKTTEFLDVMTKKVANKTLGRQMPSLVSILSGPTEDEPTSLMPPRDEPTTAVSNDMVTYATPRPEAVATGWYADKPSKDWYEIHRLSEPEYDAVFYGPQARVHIYLKDANGQYIQNPIVFWYHSWKDIPDHPDPRYRRRRRNFERMAEEPTFDGEEIVWKMILEDEMEFNVHLYLGRKGMYATYTATNDEDLAERGDQTRNHGTHISFRMPSLAREREDRYYGFDFPDEGLKLDDIRECVKPNTVTLNLPRQFRDRFATNWSQTGFEPGYNTIPYNVLVRRYPSGIRDLVAEGPSFAGRKFHARTTSNKVLLSGGAGRADTEPWEGFYATLHRNHENRDRFTKTEAIEIEIE